MSGSAAEALRKQVLGHIADSHGAGLAKSKLMEKRGMSAARYELDDALTWLEQSGQIVNVGKADARGSRGRSGERPATTERRPIIASRYTHEDYRREPPSFPFYPFPAAGPGIR